MYFSTFSLDLMNTYEPNPALAIPLISNSSTLFPIPTVKNLILVLSYFTYSKTASVSYISPSVTKKTSLGYPLTVGILSINSIAVLISVPPRSASNFSIAANAYSFG